MNILFTNHRLTRRGGTEAVIRDLANNFVPLGHSVAVYSSRPAPPGNSLADEGVPIVAHLDDLPFTPDIIHGHHSMDAMAAIMRLPGVPAIYCCHGATRSDAQPKHPRIKRYTAMTASLKLRMSIESNIPEDMIEVVHNAVDLKRFRNVREPSPEPRCILVYSRVVVESNPLGMAIKEAAKRRGLRVDFLRAGGDGRAIAHPENTLLDYDIVFASGKSAMDALACGCAVIVLGGTSGGWSAIGCGEMVTTGNFERARSANFTSPVNAPPPTVSEVGARIDNYEATDVAAVTRRLREVADFTPYVARHLELYRHAISLAQSGWDLRAEQHAAHHYLRSLFTWVRLGEEKRMDAELAHVDPMRPRDRSVNAPALISDVERRLAGLERI